MFALLIAIALVAGPPVPAKKTVPAPLHAQEVLRTQCLLLASDPKNPWAMAHAIKLFGTSFVASDGRRAIDVIIGDYLKKQATPDGATLHFNKFGPPPDSLPIEPHLNLNTKALLTEAHLPLNTTFKASFGKVTLKDLADSAKRGFRHVPQSPEYWRDVGWTLDIFSATEKPGATWKTVDGQTISLDQVFDDALAELERATADLKQGMERGDPQVDKRKQGIYAHPCGGLHFVQAVLAWAKNPEVRKRWGARVDTQIKIHFYRLESERRQYEAAYQQVLSTAPQLKLQVLVQMVKFYGHFLETAGRFRELGWTPDQNQQQTINVAKAMTDAAVRGLEAEHAYEQADTLKVKQKQVYLDLVGDSCHAAHGFEAWP
jgi:hypothetical protein